MPRPIPWRPVAVALLLAAPLPTVAREATELAVTGQVISAEGRGLAGVRVEVQAILPRGAAPERPEAAATTGPDGRFTLPVPGPGMYRAAATAPGLPVIQLPLTPLLEDVDLPPANPLDTVPCDAADIFVSSRWERCGSAVRPLPRGARPLDLQGRVIDARTRQPIAGALVWPAADPGAFVRTGGDGAWRLRWRAPAGQVALRAAAMGHRAGQISLSPRHGEVALVALLPTVAVAGAVVDERGAPVVGAEVRIEPLELTIEELSGAMGWRARTAADGRFRLPGLRPGVRYRLIATHEGFAPALAAGESGPRPLRLVLLRGRAATGRVVDEEGRPVAGAQVELRRSLPGGAYLGTKGPLDDSLYRARTGADGRFAVPHLTLGRADLAVRAAGYRPFEAPALALSAPSRTVDLGSFAITHGEEITGRVTDPAGHPIPGAEVWEEVDVRELMRDNSASYLAAGPAAVSGPGGAFALTGADPRGGDVKVCRAGYITEMLSWHGRPSGPLALVLHPAGRVEGRVVTPDGSPVAEARVSIGVPGESPSDSFGPPDPCARFSQWGVSTDAEGRFALGPFIPNWYEVTARAPGFLSARFPDPLRIAEGQTISGIEIALAPGASITGRVLTTAGAPAANVRVSAWSERGLAEAVTDGAGSYLLTGVEPGRRQVGAEMDANDADDPAETEQSIEVGPGENHLDLTLVRQVRHAVRGRVVGPDGAPAAGARLNLTAQLDPEHADAFAAEDGSFSLRLDNGPHRLWASREGFASGSAAFQIRDADVDGLEIRLPPACAVAGRLLGFDPGRYREVQVAAHQGPMAFDHMAYLDRAGNYRVEALSPGEWTITVFGAGRPINGRITLSPGSVATLDLPLAERFSVRGQVTDPAGAPLTGAEVELLMGGAQRDSAVTREDGTFQLEAENGAYTLRTSASGYLTTQPEPIELAGAPVDDVKVVLRPGATLRGRVLGVRPGDPLWIAAARGSDRRATQTDAEGAYSLEGLAAGEWSVSAALTEVPGEPSHQVTRRIAVPEGPAEVTLDLPLLLGELTLVARATGTPQGMTFLLLLSQSDPDRTVSPVGEADGVSRFTHLRPGAYRLQWLVAGGKILAERAVDLAADSEIAIDPPPQR
jgi:carboxypeptidase family protein